MRKYIFLLAILLTAKTGFSLPLKLQPGETRFSMSFGYSHFENRLNMYGDLTSSGQKSGPLTLKNALGTDLAAQLNSRLKAAANKRDSKKKASNKGSATKPDFIPIDDIVGILIPSLKASLNEYLPVFSLGVTDFWSLDIALPFYQANFKARRDFAVDPQFLNKVKEADAEDLVDLIYKKNTYSEDGEATFIADVEMLNYFNLIESYNFNVIGIFGLRLPTSQLNNDIDSTYLLPNDGQVDVITGGTLEFIHSADFRSYLTLKYDNQLSDHMNLQIPVSNSTSDDQIAAASLKRDLGDLLTVSYLARLQVLDSFSANSSFTYEQKFDDEFDVPSLGEHTGDLSRWLGVGFAYNDWTEIKTDERIPFCISMNARHALKRSVYGNENRISIDLGFAL